MQMSEISTQQYIEILVRTLHPLCLHIFFFEFFFDFRSLSLEKEELVDKVEAVV